MPIRPSERSRYPKDWRDISDQIKRRSEQACEFTCADGTRCNAPNGALIFRLKADPERWRTPHGGDCGEADPDCYGVKVVLTVAHLNHIVEDVRDENLKAGCQLHHLRHDAKHHARNAAVTRRAKKMNGELYA